MMNAAPAGRGRRTQAGLFDGCSYRAFGVRTGGAQWGDLHLDAVHSVRKNSLQPPRMANQPICVLHPDGGALRDFKGNGVLDDELVFKRIPRIGDFAGDLIQSRIPLRTRLAESGFSFAASTFGTIWRAGSGKPVAMTLMHIVTGG